MIGSIITSIYNGGTSGTIRMVWLARRPLCLLSPIRQPAADNVFYYARIVDNFVFLFVTLSMAELTSAMPTSAGVYHWLAQICEAHWLFDGVFQRPGIYIGSCVVILSRWSGDYWPLSVVTSHVQMSAMAGFCRVRRAYLVCGLVCPVR